MNERFEPDVASESEENSRTVDERFASRVTMSVPDRHNPRLHKVMDLVNQDDDLYALWLAANVNAVERLEMTDHGPVHVKIVMNIAVRMLRLLSDAGVEPSVTIHYGLPPEDAEVVVALASLLHDVGMSIHRTGHEEFSLFIAKGKLDEMLPQIYDRRTSTIMRSEVLHAIIAHRSGGLPLTLEAGIVRIADALDMAKGRSRIPFAAGSPSIHSISAQAIESVLDDLDQVLVMTVNPGFGGQKFIASMMSKVSQIRDWIERRSLEIEIEVDGGIGPETIGRAADAGANVFVAGTAIFGTHDYGAAIAQLRQAAQATRD